MTQPVWTPELLRPADRVAVAFALAFALGLVPRVKLVRRARAVLGIVIGPAGPGWVQIDETISVIALVGLVLFLAGLEIEFEQLRGRVLKLAAQGWPAAFAIAVAVGYALKGAVLVQAPLLVAVILSARDNGSSEVRDRDVAVGADRQRTLAVQ